MVIVESVDDGTKFNHYYTLRILILSDGLANNSDFEEIIKLANRYSIIIDGIGLISENRGEINLQNICQATNGTFVVPENLLKLQNKFEKLSVKKNPKKIEYCVLLIDSSGSMSESYRRSNEKKIEGAKNAVFRFVDLKVGMKDYISVILFGLDKENHVKKVIDFTCNKHKIRSKVAKLKPENGTPLKEGLILAIETLKALIPKSFFPKEPIPIKNLKSIPSGTKCIYCEQNKRPECHPVIDELTFEWSTGTYDYGAWQCCECQSYYHGLCITEHIFKKKGYGLCINCYTPLKISDSQKKNDKFTHIPPMNISKVKKWEPKVNTDLTPIPGVPNDRIWVEEKSVEIKWDDLAECTKCGYGLQEVWNECPICGTLKKQGK